MANLTTTLFLFLAAITLLAGGQAAALRGHHRHGPAAAPRGHHPHGPGGTLRGHHVHGPVQARRGHHPHRPGGALPGHHRHRHGPVPGRRGHHPHGPVAAGFVRVRGTHFVQNGAPFLFNGFNSYWMMHVAVDPNERYKVTEVFREASAAGLSVCRTWAFSDSGDRALQISPGVYDERVFQGLDFVVSEARKFGIRLILSLVNNYNDFGGRMQYAQWARNSGVSLSSDDDFYTNSVVKGYYKNHVRTVLTRFNTITKMAYKDDATIMAWELMNEPRCQADYSGKTVNAWVQEMATYVKSLDKKHLLEIGMEGFYGDSIPEKKQFNPGYQVGTDFISNNLIREIDFATIHAYPDLWLPGQSDGAQAAFSQRWLWGHWNDARNILKKPLVFSEFGKSKKDPGYSPNGRDWYFNNVYRNIYGMAKNGGTIGGGLVWQLMAGGMEDYYDGYEIVLSQDPAMMGLITRQSHVMSALAHTLSHPSGMAGGGVGSGNRASDEYRPRTRKVPNHNKKGMKSHQQHKKGMKSPPHHRNGKNIHHP